MTTVYVTTERRYRISDSGLISLSGGESEIFFERYLDSFENVVAVGRCSWGDEKCANAFFLKNKGNIHFYKLFTSFIGQAKILSLIKLSRKIKKENAIVILRLPGFLGYMLGFFCVLFNIKFGVEVVADPYQEGMFLTSKKYINKTLTLFLSVFLKLLLKKSSCVSFVTEREIQKKILSNNQINNKKYSFSYSSLRLKSDFFIDKSQVLSKRDFHDNVFHVIFIGELERPFKGLDLLIKSMSLIGHEKNIHVTVIGGGRLLEHYIEMSQSLGVSDRFSFKGKIYSDKLKIDYLDKSHLFILPSRREGLPRVIIEAMARALPCLSSNVSGAQELISEECIFPMNDYTSLSVKLIELYDNRDRLLYLSQINRLNAEKYKDSELQKKRVLFYSYLLSA